MLEKLKFYRLSSKRQFIIATGLFLSAIILIQLYFGDFLLINPKGEINWIPLWYSILPMILAFSLLRLITVPKYFALIFLTILSAALHLINNAKINETGEVLTWYDLLNSFESIEVAFQFITIPQIVFLMIGLVMLTTFAMKEGLQPPINFSIVAHITIIAVLLPIVFNRMAVNNQIIDENNFINNFLVRNGAGYLRSKTIRNYRQNGLLNHLIHTSSQAFPSKPTDQEILLLNSLPRLNSIPSQKVIFILCEACWYDTQNFHKAFNPLKNIGFKSMRSISPVYGGGTANSAFEILTGLPANNVLTGIIYQEYSNYFKDEINSIPLELSKKGYRTIAAHNYRRKFWQRHIVKPKMGFDDFITVEQMNSDFTPARWRQDAAMYDMVKKYIADEEKTFLHLTTMFTHSPYIKIGNDQGVNDYNKRLELSINQLAEFSKFAIKNSKSITILIYGDHRPNLHEFFNNSNNKFDSNYRFDVPAFVFNNDQVQVDELINSVNNKPLFCLSHEINKRFIGVNTYSSIMTSANKSCEGELNQIQKNLNLNFPEWLYSASLFTEVQ